MANKVGQIMSVMRTFANGATAQYQKIGGKAVTQIENGTAKTIRVRQGSKVATRTVESIGVLPFDILKIKNSATKYAAGKRVHSQAEEIYSYSRKEVYTRERGIEPTNGLNIKKTQSDDIYNGNELIGSRKTLFSHDELGNKRKIKEFYDKDGNLIKEVHYDPVTGMRTSASMPDGRIVRFDSHGLPQFTDGYGGAMDLGGLDKLV